MKYPPEKVKLINNSALEKKIPDREKVYSLISQGVKVKDEQLFRTMKIFSPTNIPRDVPVTDRTCRLWKESQTIREVDKE